MSTTISRINELSSERSQLYIQAGNGGSGKASLRARIAAIDRELGALWDQRRRERAGHSEGIDRVIERSYEAIYGRGYEDVVSPAQAESEADARRPDRVAA